MHFLLGQGWIPKRFRISEFDGHGQEPVSMSTVDSPRHRHADRLHQVFGIHESAKEILLHVAVLF